MFNNTANKKQQLYIYGFSQIAEKLNISIAGHEEGVHTLTLYSVASVHPTNILCSWFLYFIQVFHDDVM